ncbi:protein of unknown function [Mariniphaga anaerophila]|uniref:3-keto-alpha-glucoside-1,2-lyase/3-keto-2-hydroxy-glucal hydratase domain-containing protein n=1 Tax=Mariniphaga anaerophila TaxID=1484053 RepID=A0A1M4VGI4_9BACT|nr:DUF1080 domain-containing protein [Mariniphaga anaerophila]SHE68037.1 protein of unknown function [Mariniphaga anaerophila]
MTKCIFMQTYSGSLKVLILVLSVVVSACGSGSKSKQNVEKSAVGENTENWIQLFNGKDLNNWQIKFKGYELGYNLNNTFRVEDGLLRVSYNDWEDWNNQFGHIFYEGEFSHYRLRVEYRFVGEQVKGGPGWAYRNNGLMLHGQSAESMELDQDFPVSIEVQLLGGNGKDERSTMNLCTPGTNVVMDNILVEQHCMNSGSKTFHGDQWVSVEVEVHGGKIIRHFVEGEEVMSYEKPQLDPRDQYYEKLLSEYGDIMITSGTISLQAESHPTDFRKIELLILDEE